MNQFQPYAVGVVPSHHLLEFQVLAGPPRIETKIPIAVGQWLAGCPEYQPDRGLYEGQHYRREHGNGCLHLRVLNDEAFLHWDEWDYRRHLVEHILESPELTILSIGALVVSVLGVRALLR